MKNEAIKVLAFETPQQWRSWLEQHHETVPQGIQMRIYKKDSGFPTVTYDEALDEALCFGWIDGQKNKYDEISWLQKFTPRRKRSMWSKRNKEHVARLIREKKMQPAGLKEVEEAQQDGRWEKAYDNAREMEIPEDFLAELKKEPEAWAFFRTLNRTNTYAIAWRLQTAKRPETRQRRMEQLLGMMKNKQKLH
ncbi:MAG: YdeI/OmpD-associated family protein [Bacteroidales bacterium]|nr:YdeI/OmpD-associated family protein [Bacteroidales bacterium]